MNFEPVMQDRLMFEDRRAAGRELGSKLARYQNQPDAIVLALPRGGIPVGFEVAQMLKAPLDVFVVRKLGVPGQPELAMGAIASGGVLVLNDEVVQSLNIPMDIIELVAAAEKEELQRREEAYRGDHPPLNPKGKTVILVDDGLATGSTMRAAVRALRMQEPARLVVAVPIGAAETCALLQEEADETVCAHMPEPFYAVGMWYGDFSQTTDEEVRALLEQAAAGRAAT
jgi:putative phosphoribosyl transferase